MHTLMDKKNFGETECDNCWCRQPVCFELLYISFESVYRRCCARCTQKIMGGEWAKNYEVRPMLSQ
jgi:hypothetical protein